MCRPLESTAVRLATNRQGRRPAYAVNVGRAAYFVYRPPGDLSWRGSAVFV
jgi:hypothetical protein